MTSYKYSTHTPHWCVINSISNIFHISFYAVQSETPYIQPSHLFFPWVLFIYICRYYLERFALYSTVLYIMWPISIWCNISHISLDFFSSLFLIQKKKLLFLPIQCGKTTSTKSDTIYFSFCFLFFSVGFFSLKHKHKNITTSFPLSSFFFHRCDVSIWKRNVLSVLGVSVVQIVSCLVYHFKDNIHLGKVDTKFVHLSFLMSKMVFGN